MNRDERIRAGDGTREPHLDPVDFVLGEGGGEARAMFRDALQDDLRLALEVAEVRDLFEHCREIAVEPSGRVARDVGRAWRRRVELFRPRRVDWRDRLDVGFRVAAVALITLAVGWSVIAVAGRTRVDDRFGSLEIAFGMRGPGMPPAFVVGAGPRDAGVHRWSDPELVALLAPDALPVDDPGFVAQAERFAALPLPDEFRGLLSGENRLARLRAEAELRFSAEARARARARTGAPDLDDRIAALAADVAVGVPDAVAQVRAGGDPVPLALALRALVASGSSAEVGAHRGAVRSCRATLLAALDGRACADDARRVAVVAALTELAVLGDAELAERVADEADGLARSTLRGRLDGGARPALLNWTTPVAQLADAGRVLWIAPAFGTHAGLALRARLMVAAHLQERIAAAAGAEQPARVAALLYGFGDLIDRSEADRELALWRPRMLRSDPVAMHHLAWSKYPVRAGWAEFQRELRGVAAIPTPAALGDRSALLLSLCVNWAAPGAGDQVVAVGTRTL